MLALSGGLQDGEAVGEEGTMRRHPSDDPVPGGGVGIRGLGCRRRVGALLAIGLLALAVRLPAVVLLAGWAPAENDRTLRYDPIAMSLMDGEGFAVHGRPVASSPPLYPLLLTAVYSVAGTSATAARTSQAVIDAGLCMVFFVIARRLLGGVTAAVTGIALVLCPYLVYQVLAAGNDTLFAFLNALALLAWVRARDAPGPGRWLVVGVLIGLATLCRATSLLLAVAVVMVEVVAPRRPELRRRAVTGSLLAVLAFAACLAPWTVRNWVHFGRFIPVQTSGGYHLMLGAYVPEEEGGRPLDLQDPDRRSKDVEMDVRYYRHALSQILEHPGHFVESAGSRLLSMWYRTHTRRFETLLIVANAVLLVLAAVGLGILRSRWRLLAPAAALVAYYVAVHTVFFAIFRYLLPVVPVLVMMASVPVARILQRLPGPRGGCAPGAGSDRIRSSV
jgi:4-amino-4-deoxy-L-arabinose transferase-like glycosyltransferase